MTAIIRCIDITQHVQLCVAPKSVKTPVAGGDVANSALSPSRSVDSQLNNLSMSVSTPVSQQNAYVLALACVLVGTRALTMNVRQCYVLKCQVLLPIFLKIH